MTIVQKERVLRYVIRQLVMKILHAEVFVILRVNESIVIRMEEAISKYIYGNSVKLNNMYYRYYFKVTLVF